MKSPVSGVVSSPPLRQLAESPGAAASTELRIRTMTTEVAVIGCGHWGRNHVRNFAALKALAAVYDRDNEVARRFAKEYGVVTADFMTLLREATIKAMVIAAPAEQHFILAREALLAGKHVLVEKPLALQTSEAEELCRIAESGGLVLMVGHLLQYHPAFLKLKQLVAEGALGRLQYLYSNRLNLGKIRREENILWSFAPHDISMILSLVGSEPDRVSATGAFHLHKAIADVTTTQLAFPGGEHAHIFVSWLHPFKEQKLVVVGSEAMAVFDDGAEWDRKLLLYPHRIAWKNGMPTPEKAEAETVAVEPREPLADECRHFLDCVRTGARPRTDGREGLRVLRVLEAAERAMTAAVSASATRGAVKVGIAADARIHESAYIDDPVEIGSGSAIWHFSHILPHTRIGRNVSIGQNAMIGPKVTVGDNCKIQNNVSLYEGVVLEDGVFCGPSCVFTNVLNPRAEVSRRSEFRPTIVRRGATIGANATIVCGHEIGAYAFIAAGAVVTRDVPPFGLMAGVPARRIGWMSHAGEKLGTDLVCPRSGRRYREVYDRLEEMHS
jgi:UDP-2-acetamido-3-amino-2,3-dideoxy-glucuronate N-acetyltransferase